jgi:hypothetical protein
MSRDTIIEAMARAWYESDPMSDQEVDLDYRPLGPAYTIPWNSDALEEQRPLYRQSAQAALSALIEAGYVVVPNMKRCSFSQNNAWAEAVKAATVASTADGVPIDPTWATLLALEAAVSTFLEGREGGEVTPWMREQMENLRKNEEAAREPSPSTTVATPNSAAPKFGDRVTIRTIVSAADGSSFKPATGWHSNDLIVSNDGPNGAAPTDHQGEGT